MTLAITGPGLSVKIFKLFATTAPGLLASLFKAAMTIFFCLLIICLEPPAIVPNGFHFCMGVEPPHTNQKANRRAKLLTTDKIIANQKAIFLFLQDQLAWAQQK